MTNFIETFADETAYNEFKDSSEYVTPNVSVCSGGGSIFYNPLEKHDYSKDYLTFDILEAGTFTLTIGSAVTTSILESISYSLDDGETWTTTNNVNSQTVTITTPTVNANNKVLWKGNGVGVSTTTKNRNRPSTSSIFSSSGKFNVEGNIMSLLYGDEFEDKDYVADGSSYNFALLFYADKSRVSNVPKLVSAENLVLPVKNVPTGCYFRMFQEYQLEEYTLEKAPLSIGAESIGASGCTSMFNGCTSLATAPELPAMTLAVDCYYSMFQGCTSLTSATSVLPATTLAEGCYGNMFYGTNVLPDCSNIDFTSQSVVASKGLRGLFAGTKVTDSDLEQILPKDNNGKYCLPVTTLADSCYFKMFYDCTGLTTAPELPALTLANGCYTYMYYGCTSLTSAPELPATTLAYQCYYGMFSGCTSLTTAPSVLPATTLAEGCYTSMFQGCTNLATAPILPARTLAPYCYERMFAGCTGLTTAPELHATTLAEGCYTYMFSGCTNLNNITCLATNISATYCTSSWVSGVAASGTFTKAASMTSWTSGANGIPTGWTEVDKS